jgi:hypothetical protein
MHAGTFEKCTSISFSRSTRLSAQSTSIMNRKNARMSRVEESAFDLFKPFEQLCASGREHYQQLISFKI